MGEGGAGSYPAPPKKGLPAPNSYGLVATSSILQPPPFSVKLSSENSDILLVPLAKHRESFYPECRIGRGYPEQGWLNVTHQIEGHTQNKKDEAASSFQCWPVSFPIV